MRKKERTVRLSMRFILIFLLLFSTIGLFAVRGIEDKKEMIVVDNQKELNALTNPSEYYQDSYWDWYTEKPDGWRKSCFD